MSTPLQERGSPAAPVRSRAFTLVEMLVVMGIIAVILAVSVPAITGLKNAGDVGKTVYDIAGILDQSRTYAMTNNTYVYVGFGEADANTPDSGKQTFGNKAVGRVSVLVMASRDGTRGYDVNATSISAAWTQSYAQGKNLAVIGKVQSFTNIHLVDLGTRPSAGGMSRPPYGDTAEVDTKYNLGSTDCQSVTPISYPTGVDPATANYTFLKVIQFDPQGAARIQRDDNADGIPKLVEIGLEPARGNTAPTPTPQATTGNIAAIQIDGMLGSIRIYRP